MKRVVLSFLILIQLSLAGLAQVDDASNNVRTSTKYKNTLAVFREPEIFPAQPTIPKFTVCW